MPIATQSSSRSPLDLARMGVVADQYPPSDLLGAIYALESVSGFGPVKFRALHQAAIDPQTAVQQPDLLPLTGNRGIQLKAAIGKLTPPTSPNSMRKQSNKSNGQKNVAHPFLPTTTLPILQGYKIATILFRYFTFEGTTLFG